MFRMKRSWPGTSTTPARSAVRGVEVREAQVRCEMPRSCSSFRAIRVRPGERADERRLAVVDVSGGPDDERHQGTRASAKISRPSRMRSHDGIHGTERRRVRRGGTAVEVYPARVVRPMIEKPAVRSRRSSVAGVKKR
jgi:hypothetical protein